MARAKYYESWRIKLTHSQIKWLRKQLTGYVKAGPDDGRDAKRAKEILGYLDEATATKPLHAPEEKPEDFHERRRQAAADALIDDKHPSMLARIM